jgi:hypothetical protein
MPEAIAVVTVALLVGVLLLSAWLWSRHDQDRHPEQRRQQLQQHLRWLEDRRRHAEEHHWGDDMKHKLEADLQRTRAVLDKIPPATPPP